MKPLLILLFILPFTVKGQDPIVLYGRKPDTLASYFKDHKPDTTIKWYVIHDTVCLTCSWITKVQVISFVDWKCIVTYGKNCGWTEYYFYSGRRNGEKITDRYRLTETITP